MIGKEIMLVTATETVKVFGNLTRNSLELLIERDDGPRVYATMTGKKYYVKSEIFAWLEDLGFPCDESY